MQTKAIQASLKINFCSNTINIHQQTIMDFTIIKIVQMEELIKSNQVKINIYSHNVQPKSALFVIRRLQ